MTTPTPDPTPDPMSGLDDDQLAALLRDTFASRERLADVDTAHRLALTRVPRPRRVSQPWMIAGAVAAAVAVVAGVGVAVTPFHRSPEATSPTSAAAKPPGALAMGPQIGAKPAPAPQRLDATQGPAQLPDQQEIDAASAREVTALGAETSRFLTVHLHAKARPAGRVPAQLHVMSAVPNKGMGRTSYWVVPARLTKVADYLKHHHPAGLSATNGWGMGSGPNGVQNYTFEYDAPATAAYAMAQAGVTAVRSGSVTYLRLDTYLAKRWARTAPSTVDSSVTQVAVQYAKDGSDAPLSTTVTDPATIQELVQAFNALPGNTRPPMVWGCLAYTAHLTLTFTLSSGGTVVADELIGCGPGTVTVTRDGAKVSPALDGTGFEAKVDRLVPGVAPTS